MKKALSFLLIVVFVLGLAPASAAATWKPTGIDYDAAGYASTGFNVDVGEIYPGTDLADYYWGAPATFYMYAGEFLWNGKGWGDPSVDQAAILKLSKGQLNKLIQLRVRDTTLNKYLKKIEITEVNNDVYTFQLETVDRFVSVEEHDFETNLYFATDGSRTDKNETYFTISGTFKNPVTEVFANSVEADSWQGQVIDAQEYVKKIQLVMGCGAVADISMVNGKKIYAEMADESDAKDEPILDANPSIEQVFTFYQVGMKTYSGKIITFEDMDPEMYVYGRNAGGKPEYLGRGGDSFAVYDKYYSSTQKLDFEEEVTEEDLPEEDEPGYNPSTGI